jgi:hypothetical protein
MAYMDEFVEANEEDLVEATTISTILEYCGFVNAGDRTNVVQDGFESFDNILSLSEKDINSLSKGFSDRTAANGRINFGLRHTNHLKATIHWAQDFRRISREPTLDGIEDIYDFKDAIEKVRQ